MGELEKKIRVGVIGCGVIAPTHVECFAAEPDAQVLWACDTIEGRAQALATKYGIPHVTTSAAAVIADPAVNCISICTGHGTHSELAIASLKAGKHVLCEKALAATAPQMDAMLAAHEGRSNQVFACVFQHRFNRLYQTIKRQVEEGVYGDIVTATMQTRCYRSNEYYRGDPWRGTWDGEGGSVLINQAIHMVDIISWMLGGVEAVSGAYANLTHHGVIETEDTVTAAVKFRCGALGTFEATSSSNIAWEQTVSIHGTQGSVEVRDGRPGKMTFADDLKGEAAKTEIVASSVRDASGVTEKQYYGGHHRSQIADFVEAVREGRAPFISAQSGRHAVDIVLGIYESHRAGRWVNIPANIRHEQR